MPSSSTIQKKNSEFSSRNSSETVDNNSEGCSTISYELANEGCSQSGAFSGQGETHSLLTNIRSIDERQIIENRLSLDQIKEIPKFMNYQPGEPNKVRCFFCLSCFSFLLLLTLVSHNSLLTLIVSL